MLSAGTPIQLWCGSAATRLGDTAHAGVGSSPSLVPATPTAGVTAPEAEPAPHDTTDAKTPGSGGITPSSLAMPATAVSTDIAAADSSGRAAPLVECSSSTAPVHPAHPPPDGGRWVSGVALSLDAVSGAHLVSVGGGPPTLVHLDREHWATVPSHGDGVGAGRGAREAGMSPRAAPTPTARVCLRKRLSTCRREPEGTGAAARPMGCNVARLAWLNREVAERPHPRPAVPASDPAAAAGRSRDAWPPRRVCCLCSTDGQQAGIWQGGVNRQVHGKAGVNRLAHGE
jgi:hypothetical protein